MIPPHGGVVVLGVTKEVFNTVPANPFSRALRGEKICRSCRVEIKG